MQFIRKLADQSIMEGSCIRQTNVPVPPSWYPPPPPTSNIRTHSLQDEIYYIRCRAHWNGINNDIWEYERINKIIGKMGISVIIGRDWYEYLRRMR